MVTHRSRNKLERKAHMNIHDTIDVAEDEARRLKTASGATRDRFGKNHEILTEDHDS